MTLLPAGFVFVATGWKPVGIYLQKWDAPLEGLSDWQNICKNMYNYFYF
jgi:hypothetical protein